MKREESIIGLKTKTHSLTFLWGQRPVGFAPESIHCHHLTTEPIETSAKNAETHYSMRGTHLEV